MSLSTAPAAGRHAARSSRTLARHAPPHNDAARGLEVSLRHIPQNLLLQGKFSHQPFEPRVLLLEFLQPLRLAHLQPSLLLPPAIVRLHRDLSIPAGLRRGLPIGNLHFDLPQDVYYLLRLLPLRRHDRVSFSGEFSLISPGTKKPGHVETGVYILDAEGFKRSTAGSGDHHQNAMLMIRLGRSCILHHDSVLYRQLMDSNWTQVCGFTLTKYTSWHNRWWQTRPTWINRIELDFPHVQADNLVSASLKYMRLRSESSRDRI